MKNKRKKRTRSLAERFVENGSVFAHLIEEGAELLRRNRQLEVQNQVLGYLVEAMPDMGTVLQDEIAVFRWCEENGVRYPPTDEEREVAERPEASEETREESGESSGEPGAHQADLEPQPATSEVAREESPAPCLPVSSPPE